MKHLLLTTIAALVLVGCGPPEVDIALIDAARDGNITAVEKAIADGADLNAKDYFGGTPLQKAAFKGQFETAKLLIAEGAEVNAKAVNGGTPLDQAILFNFIEGAEETADLLRKHGGKTAEELGAEGE